MKVRICDVCEKQFGLNESKRTIKYKYHKKEYPYDTNERAKLDICWDCWEKMLKYILENTEKTDYPHGDLVDIDEVKDKLKMYGFKSVDMTISEFVEDLTIMAKAKPPIINKNINRKD